MVVCASWCTVHAHCLHYASINTCVKQVHTGRLVILFMAILPMLISWYAAYFFFGRAKNERYTMFDILLDYIELRIQMCAPLFLCKCHFENLMNAFHLVWEKSGNNKQKQQG